MDSLVTTLDSPFKSFSFLSFCKSTTSPRHSSISFLSFRNSRKFKKPSFISNSLNPSNPTSIWSNYTHPIKPFSYLIPFFKKVKDFALNSSKQNGFQETEFFMQNGAFGTALMSVTATAKVKISPIVATLAANPTFVSALCAWAASQSMKVILNFFVERKWDFKLMFACGGMPSSHSALCTALTTSVAICNGVADSLFPVCLGFSLIVMYDAIGVRRHAGMQAEVLNLIVADLFQGHPISQRKLKELLGHTPSQVFVGALLGIAIAWMCSQGVPFPV